MGYDEEMVAFVHDGARDGMAITIFGSLKSIHSMNRIPSRIPISVINPYHHEQDRDIEYPTSDRDREPFAQEVDLRYLKNINKLKNRIRSSYSCNQQLCPMIKERMDQHQLERHSSSKSDARCCLERDIDSQTVSDHLLPALKDRPHCDELRWRTDPTNHVRLAPARNATINLGQSRHNPRSSLPPIRRMVILPTSRHRNSTKFDPDLIDTRKYCNSTRIDPDLTDTPRCHGSTKFSFDLTDSPRRNSTIIGPDLTNKHSIQTNKTNINNSSNEQRLNNKCSSNKSNSYIRSKSYDYSNNEADGLGHHNHNCIGNYEHCNSENTGKRANSCNYDNNISDDNIPLKRTETRRLITPKRNVYKDFVQKEVREWFQEVPIFPNLGQNSNFNRDNIINDLTNKINNLLNETNTDTYDRKIGLDIDRSLNYVPMWYPGAKRDQDNFKKTLNNNLLNRIKDLNNKLLNKTGANTKNNTEKFKSSNRHSLSKLEELSDEVNNWLSMINGEMQMNVDKKETVKAVLKKVVPVLMKPMNSCHYKIRLKSAIVEVLNDLPVGARCSKNRNINLHRFAEDLANRLLSIKAKAENGTKYPNTQSTIYQTSDFFFQNNKNDFENVIRREINKCLERTRFTHYNDVKIEISNIIMNYVDSPESLKEFDVHKEIIDVLRRASNIPIFLASNMTQNIIKEVKRALSETNNDVSNMKPIVTRKVSVYTSEERCCPHYPVTSTPKKKKLDSVSKLNSEEIEYAQNVGNLIRAWMETLPEQFNASDEKEFKETIIKDLAGEITDEAKLEQLVSVDEKEKWRKYLVYKWLNKLDVFDLEEVVPQIEDLLEKINDIPVPLLIRPQHGNRQAMANIQHMESELGWEEYFVPKGKDVLEDEISIWMNDQPPNIFDTDKTTRNNKIHELAEVLQNKLTNKRPEKEITNDVAQWLTKILKPDQRAKVGELADNLKGRVANLPQDATLAANRDKKVQEKAEHLEAKKNPSCQPVKIKTNNSETVILDKTMQQFIAKFIEHNYDVDDPMARGAFSHLLKTKLQRLNPPTRKEVYDKFTKSETTNLLSRDKLIKELEYIKDVSDWLKSIPINAGYNAVGNRERIDFVVDLARNILEIEEQRERSPEAMDYNMYMASIISQFLVQLPITEENRNDKHMMFMIDQLVGKVIVHRNKKQSTDDSMDTSGVHSNNIGDFIEEFIRINGSEIADDEVKLEAWSTRLLNEIKKIVHENADSITLSKAQVYNRLTDVPLPADESIKEFNNEIEYIKEISEWLKNLPLLPINDHDEQERIKMICELTEKITERENKKTYNPDDDKTDAEFAEYISKWISDLSLDESREVIVAVVIKQLVNRIENLKTKQEKYKLNLTKSSETFNRSTEINFSRKEKIKTKNEKIKNPASAIVDAIEKWSASLPINPDDEKIYKSMKDDVSKKLFQKVGELSIDPRTFNDDLLYQDILIDEIDATIEKLPQNPDLQKNKDKLRTDLVQTIVEAQKAIKEHYAAEVYKKKLEHIIEASIPHPVKAKRAYDPGFEMYKSRLADIFILENFDHANDAVKMKYEKRIKAEIDKYYDSAKNRNAIPLAKDEIYHELYSVLFKVPIPNESSIIGEVEEIKTRCEIDEWFEQLPLKEANGIAELLERDKILATLAKRIHEIEKAESKPADKIQKEIMKWVVKLPLIPGEENKAEQFTNKLRDALKSSADKRKCNVTPEPNSKSKKGKRKVKLKENIKINKNDSQTSVPSTARKIWEIEPVKPKKKAGEIIIEVVEAWCNQLPVHATITDEEAKMIKDNLSTKIIIKISELNMNPVTNNDDFQYNDLLDEELDILLADIPTCSNFEESKAARKLQLKDAIKSVIPLFREEKAKYKYKQNLNTTVAKVLGKQHDTTAEKEALFQDLKEEIVECFLQLNYDIDDDEGRQAYKIKVHDAVVKFLTNVGTNKDRTSSDSLMQRNQLLCELAKIPAPSDDSLKEEVEEIRMKNEITKLFDTLSISKTGQDKNKLINQVKSILAKKLNDIELKGYNSDIETKMKQEVAKSLRKIGKEVKPAVISDFVSKLKNNESIRRAPRKIKTDTSCGKDCNTPEACSRNTQVKKKSDTIDSSSKNFNSFRNSPDMHSSPSQCTPEIKNCLEYCQNLQQPSDNSQNNVDYLSKHVFSESKTQVKCECPNSEFLQSERPEFPDEIERSDNTEPGNDEERCICGGLKKCRRPCFVPMRWFNGPDMPICRMPAGFFYY